ncbi:hypothetical protein P8452_19667 [Trifolium repens]|nr:hypothetical protein P8452_19667 [Trifolium repens]
MFPKLKVIDIEECPRLQNILPFLPTQGLLVAIKSFPGFIIQPISKSKGIEISVEEGSTSTNAQTITSPTHFEFLCSSSGQLIAPEHKITSHDDGDDKIAMTSFSIATTESNDQVSRNDDIIVSKSPVASRFPMVPDIGDPSEKVEDLSSLLVKTELEQLVSKKHMDYENLSLLTDFLVKHPSVRLKDTSLRDRYKGSAYNLLAELLKFLETHSVLDVLGSCNSEFVELLQDARNFGFDMHWLDAWC